MQSTLVRLSTADKTADAGETGAVAWYALPTIIIVPDCWASCETVPSRRIRQQDFTGKATGT